MSYNLTGTTWVFNTTLTGWTLISENATFISNNTTYTVMNHVSGSSGFKLRYGSSSTGDVYYDGLGWINDTYKTVKFTSADTASNLFYEWLSANAVMQDASNVTVTYKDDVIASLSNSDTITINTAGKYCEDDITIDYEAPELVIETAYLDITVSLGTLTDTMYTIYIPKVDVDTGRLELYPWSCHYGQVTTIPVPIINSSSSLGLGAGIYLYVATSALTEEIQAVVNSSNNATVFACNEPHFGTFLIKINGTNPSINITLNESQLTDLTGTSWYFNSMIDKPPISAMINFTSNNISYSLLYENGRERLDYNNTHVYYYDMNSWSIEAYRTIEITGGSSATDASLIAWFEENATRIDD